MNNILNLLEKYHWEPVHVTLPGNIKIQIIPQFYANSKEKNKNTLKTIRIQAIPTVLEGPLPDVEKQLEQYVAKVQHLEEKFQKFI